MTSFIRSLRHRGAPKHRYRWRIIVLGLTTLILVSFICFLILMRVSWRVEDPRRAACMGFAWLELRHYDGVNKRLPTDNTSPSGERLISWRSISADRDAALPLGDTNASWDSPANREAADARCVIYCFELPALSSDYLETKVLAVTGPDTAFDPAQEHSLGDLPADLILLVEVWGTGIHWLKPGDIDVRHFKRLCLAGPDGNGCFVAFADGTLALVSARAPIERVKKLCTITGAQTHDREELLGPYVLEVYTLDRASDLYVQTLRREEKGRKR